MKAICERCTDTESSCMKKLLRTQSVRTETEHSKCQTDCQGVYFLAMQSTIVLWLSLAVVEKKGHSTRGKLCGIGISQWGLHANARTYRCDSISRVDMIDLLFCAVLY
jgi:hypothetical protein